MRKEEEEDEVRTAKNQNLGSKIAQSHAKNQKIAGSRESFSL